MARSGISSDTLAVVALHAAAGRAAQRLVPHLDDWPIDRLRVLSKGRSDLLAEAAGLHLGPVLGRPGTQRPDALLAAALLLVAGADPDLVAAHTDVVRARVAQLPHGAR